MSEFKAGKKIEIRTLDDARPFVGMRARLEYGGRLRGEGPISLAGYYVKTRPDGESGGYDSGAVLPQRGCTLTLLGTEAENLRVVLDAAEREADKTREKHAAIIVAVLEAEERETREAEEKARAEALAEESARFPLPEGWNWRRTMQGRPKVVSDEGRSVGVGAKGQLWQSSDKRTPLNVVRAVIARYDAENPPKVEKPAGYDLYVKGLPSRNIVDQFPEILDGDVVRLTLTDGRTFIRKLKASCQVIRTTVSYRDTLDDFSTRVSGGDGYGVSKITFLRRDAAATAPKIEGYDIATAGRNSETLAAECPEIRDGDFVMLTVFDGSRVCRTIERFVFTDPRIRTSKGYPNADGSSDRWVSGTHSYGVQRITLVRRAEEPYSVQLDGRAMCDVDHEFAQGDRVLLTHEDGRETEHTIKLAFDSGHLAVSPHCGPSYFGDMINVSHSTAMKITRLEASAC